VVHLDLPIRGQLSGSPIGGIQKDYRRLAGARLINEHKNSANE
jgi:hypothetical protein